MEGHLQVQSPAVAQPTPAGFRAANGAQRPVRLLDQAYLHIRCIDASLPRSEFNHQVCPDSNSYHLPQLGLLRQYRLP